MRISVEAASIVAAWILAGAAGFAVGVGVGRMIEPDVTPVLSGTGHFPCDHKVVLTVSGGMVTAECRE